MKISNETKIGALAAISIALLILGFNFLKGKTLFERDNRLFAVFDKVEGLTKSNPVTINGLQVGKVAELHEKDKNVSGIIVAIDLTKEVNIPKNSLVFVDKAIFGEGTLVIKLGNSNVYATNGDTLSSTANPGLLESVQSSVTPAVNNLNSAIQALEVLIANVNSILDPNTKNNLQIVAANAAASTTALRNMLVAQNGELAQSLKNMQEFTANLNKNNDNINKSVQNLETATAKLAKADIDAVVKNLQTATGNLNDLTTKINSKEGSLGLLINDKSLYNNLQNSVRSLNILLDDIRVNPKRYVNISVFGKKNKGGYLEAPLDSLKKKQ
jgi:phospholipid/cholesterol/gamma-HCH transport system substrate-binding protein